MSAMVIPALRVNDYCFPIGCTFLLFFFHIVFVAHLFLIEPIDLTFRVKMKNCDRYVPFMAHIQ